jgi:hypothetical protein
MIFPASVDQPYEPITATDGASLQRSPAHENDEFLGVGSFTGKLGIDYAGLIPNSASLSIHRTVTGPEFVETINIDGVFRVGEIVTVDLLQVLGSPGLDVPKSVLGHAGLWFVTEGEWVRSDGSRPIFAGVNLESIFPTVFVLIPGRNPGVQVPFWRYDGASWNYNEPGLLKHDWIMDSFTAGQIVRHW